MANLQSITTKDDSITWRIYNLSALTSATRIFKFWLDGKVVASNIRRPPGTTDVTYTFTGLQPRTTYKLKAMFYTEETGNEYYYENEATTMLSTVLMTTSSTPTSITWRIYSFRAIDVKRTFNFYINGEDDYYQRHVATITRLAGTTDVEYTYTGLDPNKSYDLYATMIADGSSNTYEYRSSGVRTKEETHYVSISASGDYESIFMYTYGMNSSAITRYLKFYVDGAFVEGITIPAGDISLKTASYYNISEGRTYTVEARLYDGSDRLLAYDSTIVSIPRDTAISLRSSNITENSVMLTAYGLNTGKNYARMLKWYRKGPKDNDYVLVSSTNIPAGSGNSSHNFTLSNLRANSAYSFKVELHGSDGLINSKTVTVNTLEVAGTLAVDNIGESSVTLMLTGLTDSIGRTVKWFYKRYTETNYTFAGSTDISSSASSVSKVISSLVNETSYNFKAEIYDADDKDYIVGIKSAVATTQRQVAVMELISATSVSLRVSLMEMETNVTYDKYIYWYIKRSSDANYTEAGLDIVTADSGAPSVSRIFTDLVSSTLNPDGTLHVSNYDIRAVIKKNDAATMATINRTYATTLRDSDIPTPTITEVLQTIGEKSAEVWWEAPEHVASNEAYVHYDIEVSEDGDTWQNFKTVDNPPADYTLVTFSEFDTEYFIRIKAYPVGSEEEFKLSNVALALLAEDFDWETVKQGEECVIRADKWNLLIRYIRKRLEENKISTTYVMTRAKVGNPVTADLFNQIISACNAFYDTGIVHKLVGDADRAAELLKIQEAVNYKEAKR